MAGTGCTPSTPNSSASRRPHELERMDSADPPLAVDRLHADGDRQLRSAGHGPEGAELGDLLAVAPARAAAVQRPVHVRAPVCRQLARGATHQLIGDSRHAPEKEARKAPTLSDRGTP